MPLPAYEIVASQLPKSFNLPTLRTDSAEARRMLLPEADFILVATEPLTEEMMHLAPRLRLIQHQGVGYDTTDVRAAKSLGIPVGLTPEGTTVGVAEHTILLILAAYKRLILAHTSLGQPDGQYPLRHRFSILTCHGPCRPTKKRSSTRLGCPFRRAEYFRAAMTFIGL